MVDKKIGPLQFTDGHYIALGKLLIEFQTLDQCLNYALLGLMRPVWMTKPSDGVNIHFTNALIGEFPFSKKLDLITSFIEAHGESYFVPVGSEYESVKRDEFKESSIKLFEALKESREVENERNRIIHSHWITDPVGGPVGTVGRMKMAVRSKKIITQWVHETPESIACVVERAANARTNVHREAQVLEYLLYAKTAT